MNRSLSGGGGVGGGGDGGYGGMSPRARARVGSTSRQTSKLSTGSQLEFIREADSWEDGVFEDPASGNGSVNMGFDQSYSSDDAKRDVIQALGQEFDGHLSTKL